MTRYYAVIAILLLLMPGLSLSARPRASEKIKPRWIHDLPQLAGTTYSYEIVTSSGSSLEDARQKSLAEIISDAGLRNGVVVVSDYHSKESTQQRWINGKLQEQIDFSSCTLSEAKGNEVKLFVESVAEYWECDAHGKYYMTRLYARSESSPVFDDVEISTRYGLKGLWRSLIIPGWGQFHKGSTLKGGLILGGSAAIAAGIIATEQQRLQYTRKITLTHNELAKRTYATRADNLATGRNICIGALAALYVYNLIDALVAPGASYIIVKGNRQQAQTYAIAPTLLDAHTPGITATVTF